ncbi:hypothetical protein ACJA3G_35755, partial [Streptomyces sp. YS-3]
PQPAQPHFVQPHPGQPQYVHSAAPGTVTAHPSGAGPTQPPRKRKRAALVVAVAVAAAIVGVGGYLVSQLAGGDSDAGKPTHGGSDKNSAQPGSSTPGTGAGSANNKPPAAPKGTVYKNMSITRGYSVNFADEPPQPQKMDVFYEGDFGYAEDIVNGDALATNQSKNTMALLESGEPGTLVGCRANTRYTTSITRDKVGKGSRICVKTGSGHYGLVTVLGFAPKESASQFVGVDLTVWRNVTTS